MSLLDATLLPYETTDISEPSVVRVQIKINESEESRTKCLEKLRNSLKDLKDIEPCIEGEFLLRFARVAKFDASEALRRVLKYYRQQEVLLDAFRSCSLSFQKARKLKHVWLSPYRLPNNSCLLILLGNVDYREYTFVNRFYVEILALNKILDDAINQICGVTVLIDYEGFDIHAVLAYKPSNCRLFLESTLVFHHLKTEDWKTLHTVIPPDVLPEAYGGKLKHESLINGLDGIEQLEEDFHRLFNYGYRETKQCRKAMKVLS